MIQIARNLTDSKDGILIGTRYLIHDRDSLFSAEFLNMISAAGVESVKLPPRSPNLNAYAERFVRSIKESYLDRMIFFGEESLRTAIQNFAAHYHNERNHQGLANQLISPEAGHLGSAGEVQRRQRLGGMLNYYYRAACRILKASSKAPRIVTAVRVRQPVASRTQAGGVRPRNLRNSCSRDGHAPDRLPGSYRLSTRFATTPSRSSGREDWR
jgi:hypothetical protein